MKQNGRILSAVHPEEEAPPAPLPAVAKAMAGSLRPSGPWPACQPKLRQERGLVEPRGIEPLTSAVRLQRSPS